MSDRDRRPRSDGLQVFSCDQALRSGARRMLLRRVIEHVREQSWTAIAIDFVIVVIGVFVGIQVANWNEERVERQLVRGHLTEIAEDLRTYLELDEAIVGSAKLRIAAVDYIYKEAFGTTLPTKLVLATETWEAPPSEPIPDYLHGHLMGAVNLVRVSVRSRNGYESMLSTGRLGLLRNRALAQQIQTYYGNLDDLLDTNAVFRMFRNDGAREQFPLGVSVFDQRPDAEIIALAKQNTEFAAYLRSQREWAILHHNLLQDMSKETGTLLAAIERELAEP